MCERRGQTQFGDAAKQHSARTARIPIGPRGAYAERGLQGEAAPRDDLASASTLCRHLGAQGLVAQPIHIVYYSIVRTEGLRPVLPYDAVGVPTGRSRSRPTPGVPGDFSLRCPRASAPGLCRRGRIRCSSAWSPGRRRGAGPHALRTGGTGVVVLPCMPRSQRVCTDSPQRRGTQQSPHP